MAAAAGSKERFLNVVIVVRKYKKVIIISYSYSRQKPQSYFDRCRHRRRRRHPVRFAESDTSRGKKKPFPLCRSTTTPFAYTDIKRDPVRAEHFFFYSTLLSDKNS